MRVKQFALCSGLTLISSSELMAAGGGGEGGIFIGDLGNAIWTFVIFVIVLVVLGKFAWGPMLNGLQKREEFIRTSLADAKSDREQAQKSLVEYQTKLRHAQEQAAAVVEEGRRDAEETRKRIVAEARAEAESAVERAKRDIELARNDALQRLHDQSVALSTTIAGRMLQRELKASDHESLINDAIAEMSRMNN